ncbi:MAG: MBL fold metallo-hydrolase [Phycisphaerae bacterium]|nr:MBL fold metallo-hydrolase [Phycisphaerae bacterium]
MAELEFFGAAGTVTGSMHLLHLDEGCYALDCGLYQGRREDARKRNTTFPVAPDALRGVLLSHAHIDHSGNLPGLTKRGFTGPVHATAATCSLVDVMLADSAHIQQEDARFWNEKRATRPSERIEPLYTIDDAKAVTPLLNGMPCNEPFEFAPDCNATFLEAGHLLGAAATLISLRQSRPMRILYTGDLGRAGMPILRDPAKLPTVDYLITDSTYADRRHAPSADMKQALARIINQTRAAGGKVIIPAFSVGRTQNVVYYLAQALAEKLIEPIPIVVDSPLSANVTEIFRKHTECYRPEARDLWWHHGGIFGEGVVRYITDVNESKALNDRNEPMVIIASQGMCEAGRILHHLKNNVENERNTVVIVGFMAQHTLGRRIVERREEIKIFGRMYRLLCRVETLSGFSAHADSADYARMLGPLAPQLRGAFIVHGEGPQPLAMADLLKKAGCKNIAIPKPGQRFELA